jgi:hypothetical protein
MCRAEYQPDSSIQSDRQDYSTQMHDNENKYETKKMIMHALPRREKKN